MTEHLVHLVNRDSLFDELNHYVEQHQQSGKKLALLLVNIDHFRKLNTVFGYQTGDAFLHDFARRLDDISRSKDYIARMGNSEFIMLLPEIINVGHAELAVHKLLNAMNEPFIVDEHSHKISAHVGISIYPDHGEELHQLMQKAEIAMMSARNSPQAYAFFSETSEEAEINAWDIEGELEAALENDGFQLYYQPQVSMQSGHVFGAEALIRWQHQTRGFIRPDIFIPVAEQSGQILPITWWCINTALRQLKEWPTSWRPLKVSVNISARVLKDVAFVDSVKSALSIWGVPAEQLTLEVTESALVDDVTTSFITLEELRSLGVGISIDDFGTGYSSMAYFKNIPANELKIDQSFVFYMLENAMDQHIVNTVIELGRGFNLKVVAEGIENMETFQALKELGCDIAQGYHIARPMPLADLVQWLTEHPIFKI